MRLWPAGVALLGLTACTWPAPACTQVGASSGVAVTVTQAAAARVSRLDLRVCTHTGCTDHRVGLQPGSDSVDQGCDPDGVCSATAVPDGTLVGFVEVADLPTGPVRVSATVTRGSRRQRLAEATVAAGAVHPNGRGCPGEANQARVVVELDQLR